MTAGIENTGTIILLLFDRITKYQGKFHDIYDNVLLRLRVMPSLCEGLLPAMFFVDFLHRTGLTPPYRLCICPKVQSKLCKPLTSTLGSDIIQSYQVSLAELQQNFADKERRYTMNKEEILAMSRKENDKKDPFELEVNNKAVRMAHIATAIVVFIIYVTGIMVNDKQDYLIWSIMAVSMGTQFLYRGIKLKKKDTLMLGALWAVIFLISFIVGMIKLVKR